jgi:hypothetical protein
MNEPSPLLGVLTELATVPLVKICTSDRFSRLDRADACVLSRQYKGRRYDWDGYRDGAPDENPYKATFSVPMRMRRPSTKIEVGKVIVTRLTGMALAGDSWPTLRVNGDPQAEDFVRALVESSQLPSRLKTARNRGGAAGAVALSFAFVGGLPRVRVHRIKHLHVLRWADRDEWKIGAVVKVYRLPKSIVEGGKIKDTWEYIVRYWDENWEIAWEPISEEHARNPGWVGLPSRVVRHGYGETPVYWIQNAEDTEDPDGEPDFGEMAENGSNFDQINYLASATTGGTIANVDPTLVILDEKMGNEGKVSTGSASVIYSKGGAKYLELTGDSVKTAVEWMRDLTKWCFDASGVVVPDQTAQGRQESAAAIKSRFLPMSVTCDEIRGQYGAGLKRLLRGMLRAAKKIGSSTGQVVTLEDGTAMELVPSVMLPPRIDLTEEKGEDGKVTVRRTEVERVHGTSEEIELEWPAYFRPSTTEVSEMATAASTVVDKVISRKTAAKYLEQVMPIGSIDEEMLQMEVEAELRATRFPGPEGGPPGLRKPAGGDDEDEGDEDEDGKE